MTKKEENIDWYLESETESKSVTAELFGVNYGVGRVGRPASQLFSNVNSGKCGTVR